jgi:hypothetical protein
MDERAFFLIHLFGFVKIVIANSTVSFNSRDLKIPTMECHHRESSRSKEFSAMKTYLFGCLN